MKYLLLFFVLLPLFRVSAQRVTPFALDTAMLHHLISTSTDPSLRRDTLSRVILDTAPMPLQIRFQYDNIPQAQSNERDFNPYCLGTALHYLTAIPENNIPERLEDAKQLLADQRLRLFRLKNLQIKAVQLLIANGFPLLVDMSRINLVRNQAGDNLLRVNSQSFFNVVKGYSPIDLAVLPSLEKGYKPDSVVFYFYENYGFAGNYMDTLDGSIRSRLPIVNGHQTASRNQLCRFNAIYLIAPAEIDEPALKKMFKGIHESMTRDYHSLEFGYYAPDIEELK
jgi:hypothetical protein